MLLDSSSSLLFSLLLAQLPVFTSASPVPQRRPTDMDKLSNQTKNLMKLTQELLVSEDALVVITNIDWLLRPWPSRANWIAYVRGVGEGCWSLCHTLIFQGLFFFSELCLVCSGFSLTKLLSLMTDWLESIRMLRSGQQKPQGRFDWVISLLIYCRLGREGMSDSATSWSAWSPDWWRQQEGWWPDRCLYPFCKRAVKWTTMLMI